MTPSDPYHYRDTTGWLQGFGQTNRRLGGGKPLESDFSYQFSRFSALVTPMHYDAHQPIIDDLEARITTIRDSL
jgi:hypothetical protein